LNKTESTKKNYTLPDPTAHGGLFRMPQVPAITPTHARLLNASQDNRGGAVPVPF